MTTSTAGGMVCGVRGGAAAKPGVEPPASNAVPASQSSSSSQTQIEDTNRHQTCSSRAQVPAAEASSDRQAGVASGGVKPPSRP